jgi:non-canonical (house-cleaning) NTP pyrophosphatase
MDQYAHQKHIKHNEGAVGIFTNHLVKRQDVFEQIVKVLIGSMGAQKNNIQYKEYI